MEGKLTRVARAVLRRDVSVVAVFSLLFLLLNWRLVAFGTSEQLFLYGDNLSVVNNLFYLFENFSITDPFATYIGEFGARGAYPMAEPQNSIFYLPFSVMLVLFRLFDMGPVGLYYLVLANHFVHLMLGVYFVFRTADRILELPRHLAFLAGLIFIGLGWTAGWFGTNTLSFMTGLVPVVVYSYLRLLQHWSARRFAVYVLAMAAFLFAGGIANYFFFLWLNSALLLVLFHKQVLAVKRSDGQPRLPVRAACVLVAAPLWAVAIYAVQLQASLLVFDDISHANSDYDSYSVFGNHFGDLIGLLLPKFGLLGFGTLSNPDMYWKFLNANQIYVGILPLVALVVAIFFVRNRTALSLVGLFIVNFALSFGAMFVAFDATLLFPGNTSFRGHWKYLTFAGLYLALLTPIVARHLMTVQNNGPSLGRLLRAAILVWTGLLVTGVAAGIATFVTGISSDPQVNEHYTLATSASNYVFRTIIASAGVLAGVYALYRWRRPVLLLLVAVIAFADTSINYKYAAYYDTQPDDLVAGTFFECCRGRTVVNDLNGYAQPYLIPEIVGVDTTFMYSAIGNKYLTRYQASFFDSNGQPVVAAFRAAGVDGLLTNREVASPEFRLADSTAVTTENVEQYYHYNPDGPLHSSWGGGGAQVGSVVNYYELSDSPATYFSSGFEVTADDDGALERILSRTSQSVPVVSAVDLSPRNPGTTSEATVDLDRPAHKIYTPSRPVVGGSLVTDIPYSSAWRAEVNGEPARVVRVNASLVGVVLPDGLVVEDVVIEVDDTKLWASLAVSGLALAAALLLALHSSAARDVHRWRLRGPRRISDRDLVSPDDHP